MRRTPAALIVRLVFADIRLQRYAMLSALLLAIAVIIGLWTRPTTSIFMIDARTDAAHIQLGRSGAQPVWAGDLLPTPFPPGCAPTTFTPASGAVIDLTRTPETGLRLEVIGPDLGLDSDKPDPPAGSFECDGGPRPASATVGMTLSPRPTGALPKVFAFRGAARLGSDIEDGAGAGASQPPFLRSGSVSSRSLSWPFKSAREEFRQALSEGDTVALTDRPRRQDRPQSVGYVEVDHDPTPRVVVKGNAAAVEILGYGEPQGDAALLAPNLLARIKANAEWLLMGVLAYLGLKAARTAFAIYAHDSQEDRRKAVHAQRLWQVLRHSRRRQPPPVTPPSENAP